MTFDREPLFGPDLSKRLLSINSQSREHQVSEIAFKRHIPADGKYLHRTVR